MRLIAYDLEALVRSAQQAPWRDGFDELRKWCDDVRRTAKPEGGFGRGDGDARRFDAARLELALTRLERLTNAIGDRGKPLRELLGDRPDEEWERGYSSWDVYEDLTRAWTILVSAPWPDAALTALDGAGALLGPLGKEIDRDLRLVKGAPLFEGVGRPYPPAWQDLPRARIHNVATELLDHLCEIGRGEVERAAASAGRPANDIAADVGRLIRHCELARQFDTVVAVDPSDDAWR